MNLYDFYIMLSKLDNELNYKKELLLSFTEQFAKIDFLNLSREKKELTIFSKNIEKYTDVRTINDLQCYIKSYFINIDDMKKFIINVFNTDYRKTYKVKDIDIDIDNTITIGIIEN